MALGTSPNPLIRTTTHGIEANKHGCLVVDETMKTTRDGVYAGGDAVTGAATVILAMGAGKTLLLPSANIWRNNISAFCTENGCRCRQPFFIMVSYVSTNPGFCDNYRSICSKIFHIFFIQTAINRLLKKLQYDHSADGKPKTARKSRYFSALTSYILRYKTICDPYIKTYPTVNNK